MTASSLLIEPAGEDDLPQIHRLYESLGPRAAAPIEKLREVFNAMSVYPSYSIYKVSDGRGVCGTFALLIFIAPGARCAPVGVLEDVVVDAGRRGEGIGKEMVQFAVERCRDAGCYKLMLSSNLARTDAHRFYERLGFQLHGYSLAVELHPGSVQGGFINGVE